MHQTRKIGSRKHRKGENGAADRAGCLAFYYAFLPGRNVSRAATDKGDRGGGQRRGDHNLSRLDVLFIVSGKRKNAINKCLTADFAEVKTRA